VIAIKFHSNVAETYVMRVRRAWHRRGVTTAWFATAEDAAIRHAVLGAIAFGNTKHQEFISGDLPDQL
jgi:hypothetical protein